MKTVKTEETSPTVPFIEPAFQDTDWYKNYLSDKEKRDKKRLSRAEVNKAQIFKALKSMRAHSVKVEYAGFGDDGGIDGVTIYTAKNKEMVPKKNVNVITESSIFDDKKSEWVMTEKKESVPLKTAIEDYSYDILHSLYAGYENNDGGSGSFSFSVKTGKVTLSHTEYYMESTTTETEV